MTHVDQAVYSHDLAKCVSENAREVTLGNGITRCMRRKGYKILYGY